MQLQTGIMGLKKGAFLDQAMYRDLSKRSMEYLGNAWRNSLDNAQKTAYEDLKRHASVNTEWGSGAEFYDTTPLYSRDGLIRRQGEQAKRKEFVRDMIMKQAADNLGMAKASGVTTSLGFNFIDLRGPALFLAPINVPFRNSLARVGRQNDGYGTAPIWRASTNLGQNYGGVSEGQRNSTRTPNQITYTVPYKQIGGESAVTTSAEWASEGYSPQLADEHIRGLLSLFLSEEAIDLHGNAGTSAAGYALGTPAAPAAVQNTVSSTGFTATTHVSACCVYLTAMGNPVNNQYGYLTNLVANGNTVTGGLVNSVIRTNADLSQDTIPGGISGVSPMSSVVTCDSTHTATFTAWSVTQTGGQSSTGSAGTVGAPKGVFGYAWFVNIIDSSAPKQSNAILSYITQYPTLTVTSAAQAGTQTAASLLVNGSPVDNSYNPLDYTGLIGYAASTAGAYWADLQGGGLTSSKTGKINELENMLEYIYNTYQANVNTFWVSPDVAEAIDNAVRWGGTGGQPFQFFFTRDQQNNLMGGFVVSTYQSRFAAANPLGGTQIPIMIHPMMPAGTLYADIRDIPAGYESARLPYLRAILARQDYISYEWPMVTRQWTFGTYAEQVFQHLMPWIAGVITGINGFTQD